MKKRLLAIALSTIGAVGAVQAGAVAQSSLQILNLNLLSGTAADGSGGTVLDASQFSFLQISDATNLNATVTPGGATPFTASTAGGVALPYTQVCFPVACPAGLTAPGLFGNATTPATSNGALAASSLNGAPITGLPAPVVALTGANARTNAVAERTTTGAANTTSALTVATQFQFVPLTNLAITIRFSAIDHLLAYLDTQTNAIAGSTWSANITNHDTGATVFDWVPNGSLAAGGITGGVEHLDPCSLTRTLTAFGPTANATYNCGSALPGGAAAFSATSNVLLAGIRYDFAINHQNQANVSVLAVPEPSMLSLLGLALAGIAFTTRRKSKA